MSVGLDVGLGVGLDVGLGVGLGLGLGVGLSEHLKSGMLLDMCLGDWSLAPNKIPTEVLCHLTLRGIRKS